MKKGPLYLFFLLTPVQFFGHYVDDSWQGFLCSLHIQKGQASTSGNHIHCCAGVLFNTIDNLEQ